jgi:hypothetical protein
MVFVAVSHMLILICQSLWARYRQPDLPPVWRPAVAIVASGLLTIVLYAPMMGDMWAFYTTDRPKVASEWTKVTWAVGEALRGLQLGYGVVLLIGLATIGLVGCWRFWRGSPVALALMVAPGLLGLAVMVATGRNIWPRFFLYVFGNALLIVIHGVWGCAEMVASVVREPNRRAAWSTRLGYALCAIAVLQSLRMLPRLYQLPKQDLRGAVEFVEQQRGPGDQVATLGLASVVFQRFYHVTWVPVERESELDELTRPDSRLWVVTTFPIHLESRYPALAARLQKDFRTVKTFWGTLGGGEIQVSIHERQASRRDGTGGS